MSSSIGSRHIEASLSVEGWQGATRPKGTPLLQPGHYPACHVRRLLGDHLDHAPLELADDFQINERLGDVELQAELLAYFGCQS